MSDKPSTTQTLSQKVAALEAVAREVVHLATNGDETRFEVPHFPTMGDWTRLALQARAALAEKPLSRKEASDGATIGRHSAMRERHGVLS